MSSRASRSQNPRLSQSQSQSQQRMDDKVRAILKYILDHLAEKIPIKEKDMLPSAGGRDELRKRLPLVIEQLEQQFGIKLSLLDPASPQNKTYICFAETPMASIHEMTPSQRHQLTLLYIILTYIFMRSNRIEAEKLYAQLETLDIFVDEDHGYFGNNIRKLIEETFVRQQYLKRERSQLSAYNDPKVFFLWGLRAKAEISYDQIVQFASSLLKIDRINFEHYLKKAQENAEAQ